MSPAALRLLWLLVRGGAAPVVAVLLLGAPLGARGQLLGEPFQVSNTPPQNSSYATGPDVSANADGEFVVVWSRSSYQYPAGPDAEILARRYDAGGTPLGVEFQVNTATLNPQQSAAVAMKRPDTVVDPGAEFVVIWDSYTAFGGFVEVEVFGQRYDGMGATAGGEFQVNCCFVNNAGRALPSVAMDPSGNFTVVWESEYQSGIDTGIYGQRYDASGMPIGNNFVVNSDTQNTNGYQRGPAIAMDAAGAFVVVWRREYLYGQPSRLLGRRFDAAGAALGDDFEIAGDPKAVEVAMDADGDFVVVWGRGDYSGYDVFARRYDGDGVARGDEFRVSTAMPFRTSYSPDVAAQPDGNFLIVWSGSGGLGVRDILGRLYRASGAAAGSAFEISNPANAGVRTQPAVAARPDDEFVVAWQGPGPSSGQEIFARLVPEPGRLALAAAAIVALRALAGRRPT